MRRSGNPALWLCDPMHGNNLVIDGVKTRLVPNLVSEVEQFVAIARSVGVHACSDPGLMPVETSPSQNHGTLSELLVKTNSGGSDRHRAIYGFAMPAIGTGEVVTSAILRLRVTQLTTNQVAVHRVTDTWVENTVTWANTGADIDATAEISFTPDAVGFRDVDITALMRGWHVGTFTNHGLMLVGATNADAKFTTREWGTTSERPQLTITTVQGPILTVLKSSSVFSDPFNGSTNPKAILGAAMAYTISARNSANGSSTPTIAPSSPTRCQGT